MSNFSPAQSSDIYVVLQEIVNSKVKMAQLKEDIKETIKGLVEQHKGELTASDINSFVAWLMAPEKKDEGLEKLEETQAKFEQIMSMRKQFKQVDAPLDLDDLD